MISEWAIHSKKTIDWSEVGLAGGEPRILCESEREGSDKKQGNNTSTLYQSDWGVPKKGVIKYIY